MVRTLRTSPTEALVEVRVAHCLNAQDLDCDGVLGIHDHCHGVANARQEDQDGDGIRDACDNCPDRPNANQAD